MSKAPNQRRGPEQELLASELLIPMAKFSKYLTGCAALHTGAVETLPYWFEEPAVKEALASQPLEGASYSLAAVRDWAPAAELDEAQRRQLPDLLKDVSGRSDGTFRTERTVASAVAPADRTRSSRDLAEIQPRSSRGLAEIQPRSSRDLAEIQPRSSRDLKALIQLGLKPKPSQQCSRRRVRRAVSVHGVSSHLQL